MNRRDFFVSMLKTAVAAAAAPTIMKLAGTAAPRPVVNHIARMTTEYQRLTTAASFEALLNLYMPVDLLVAEMRKRDFLLQKVAWAGNYELSWDDEVDA